ncbi:MAG TPA: hypothetical protein VG755_39395 [Nannocystaceae bacterium]|nr:hypothetical protein [Nannocystaceae bacterium]
MQRSPYLLALALFACSRPPTENEAAKTDAKAPVKDPVSEATLQKRAEARKAAETKAEADAKQKEATLEQLAQPGQSPPKTLPKACKAMVSAYDQYMRRVLTDDMLTKWTTGGNEMQVKVFEKECLSRSIAVAACQADALGKMTREQYPLLADVMGRCLSKFGGSK